MKTPSIWLGSTFERIRWAGSHRRSTSEVGLLVCLRALGFLDVHLQHCPLPQSTSSATNDWHASDPRLTSNATTLHFLFPAARPLGVHSLGVRPESSAYFPGEIWYDAGTENKHDNDQRTLRPVHDHHHGKPASNPSRSSGPRAPPSPAPTAKRTSIASAASRS